MEESVSCKEVIEPSEDDHHQLGGEVTLQEIIESFVGEARKDSGLFEKLENELKGVRHG